MSGVPVNDGLWPGIPDKIYHGDRNSLSSSGARMLINLTPAEFLANQLEPPNPKPEYDFGHAAHKMVLGEGAQLVRVDARDWRTNIAKEAREKAWAAGKAPLLKHKIQLAQTMAGKVFAHPLAAKLLESGSAEMSGYWHDDATGVRLRCRPDWLPNVGGGRPIIVDYKSAASANPYEFRKAAFNFGYFQQAPWYVDGLREITGADDIGFLFIVQQKDPPFLVSVCQLDAEDIEMGRRRNRRAIELFARCRDTNSWPGYEGITTCPMPGWARKQLADEELQDDLPQVVTDLSNLEPTSYAEPDHITLNDLIDIN